MVDLYVATVKLPEREQGNFALYKKALCPFATKEKDGKIQVFLLAADAERLKKSLDALVSGIKTISGVKPEVKFASLEEGAQRPSPVARKGAVVELKKYVFQ